MSLSEAEQNTINYYNLHAQEWADSHGYGQPPYFEMALRSFRYQLPEGRVLEIGSGFGGVAKWLVERRYDYVGIDPADGQREIAKKDNPGVTFLDGTAYDIAPYLGIFDGFLALAVFIHLPKDRLAEVLGKIHAIVRDGGVGLVTVMEGDADLQEQRPGRSSSLWRQEEFAGQLEGSGYSILKTGSVDAGSSLSRWLTYLVSK